MNKELMNIRSIIMGLVILMLVYLAINMFLNAGAQHVGQRNKNNPDPAVHLGMGNKMVANMTNSGDMVGIYSANLTGGIKLNYPWPLRDGPGMSVNMNA